MTANKHTPMVVAAARALCRRDSDLCGVDFDDNWKLYGDGFLADAQVALESIAAPELLEILRNILPFVATQAIGCHGDKCREEWCFSCNGEEDAEAAAKRGSEFFAEAHSLIAKAAGGAA